MSGRIMSASVIAACALGLVQGARAGSGSVIGSPVINRPQIDGLPGVTVVYRGATQPVAGPGEIVSWSAYQAASGGPRYVTPLLIEVIGPGTFEVVGIGASRQPATTGVNSFPFSVSVGSAVLEEGKQYTIGFTHARYGCDGAFVSASDASVKFDGFDIDTDLWQYVDFSLPAPGLGTVYGGASFPAFANERIYSVQFTSSTVPPTCAADLTFDGAVDSQDLNVVLGGFGTSCPETDVNGDGFTDSVDLNLLLAAFGQSCTG